MRYTSTETVSARTGCVTTPALKFSECSGFSGRPPFSSAMGLIDGIVPLVSIVEPVRARICEVLVRCCWPGVGALKPVLTAPRRLMPGHTSMRVASLPLSVEPASV
jgi:hypothetical protein